MILNNIKELEEELATMKYMIYSLYKSITLDENLENCSEWEKECRELAKKHFSKAKDKGDK